MPKSAKDNDTNLLFVVNTKNAQGVITLLDPLIQDQSIAPSLRTYYQELLVQAQSLDATEPTKNIFVAICRYTGLVFECQITRGRRREKAPWLDRLLDAAHNNHKGSRYQSVINELEKCREQGITNPKIILKRGWDTLKNLNIQDNIKKPINPVDATIIVDDRESRSGIITKLEKSGITIQRERLEVGDYRCIGVSASWTVERKQAKELAVNIRNNFLEEQLARMRENAQGDHLILIIQGNLSERGTAIRDHAIEGFIAKLMLIGFVVWQVSTEDELVQMLIALARNANKAHLKDFRLSLRTTNDPQHHQLAMLQQLPNIGRDHAQALLKHFGSIAKICAATPAELKAVPRIGETIAQRIWETIHQELPTSVEGVQEADT